MGERKCPKCGAKMTLGTVWCSGRFDYVCPNCNHDDNPEWFKARYYASDEELNRPVYGDYEGAILARQESSYE